jgi:RNA polymerase subunit RPABC4/transcription elongation factor Spt4
MPEYDICKHCGGEVTKDSDFCPHCGVLFTESESVFCETHQDRRANGVCIICRKLVCEKCGSRVHRRMFCTEHKDVEVQQDWALIFESTDINEAELAKSFLQSASFHMQLQSFNSIGFVWDGGGDSALSRSALSKPAKIFVPIPEYLAALKAFQEWQSGRSVKGDSGAETS